MFEVLDHHLSLLDNADISQDSVFKSGLNKEHYETLLMYAFRKLSAANYHRENIIKFIAKEKEISEYEKPKDVPSNISMDFRAIKTADEYVRADSASWIQRTLKVPPLHCRDDRVWQPPFVDRAMTVTSSGMDRASV